MPADSSDEHSQSYDALSNIGSVDDIDETPSECDVSDDKDSRAAITENTKIIR